MTAERSLRSRIVLGAILWTAGLLAIVHVASAFVVFRYNYGFVAHGTAVCIGAICLIVLGLSQVKRGISPFNRLREQLSKVRDGRAPRVEGSYPDEVQPLVNDLNSLLDQRDQAVRRAQAKAGDLAHGLKTPLALLVQEADHALSAGHTEIASTIRQLVDRIRRQTDYHLAQTRAASGPGMGVRCNVKDSADGLVRTLNHLYAERGLTIEVAVPPDNSIAGQREDLDEMLGNLLDNACKWAHSRITVSSTAAGSGVDILVDDDGAGLAPSMREAVLQRGVRADERGGGSGLGLAIVRDLAELYGGSVSLNASPLGGLRARLQLPNRL